MHIVDLLLGRPLSIDDEMSQTVGPLKGIPIFGLDALSSAAYGPEAALTVLLGVGIASIHYIWPITVSIVVLLGIVYFSYRQTITAYPRGGGSYTVASENLGPQLGLLAAASLMLDYVLTAAVGISAGVGALISAVPSLQQHTLLLCLGILAVLTLVNLRGVREAGAAFLLPTYLFIASLLIMIAAGMVKSLIAGGHPAPVIAPPRPSGVMEAVGAWLLLRAFASGCTAMTGVEAVSNGVAAFRKPPEKYARLTLSIVIAILAVMLLGIAYLVRVYGVAATPPGEQGYQSVLSQLLACIFGRGAFYWVAMASILAVLSLSANTAFADFPRLAHAVAQNRFLPHPFTARGRRLVYEEGVYALTFLTALLLVLFGGVTDRLIPLYAVGAFLAFTLSQAGMVVHWKRAGGRGARSSMLLNGVGAIATGITVMVVLIAKFTEGAWITVIIVPSLILMMHRIKRHYLAVEREISRREPVNTSGLLPPIVLLPLEHWTTVSEKALRFAWTLSPEIQILHICREKETQDLQRRWESLVSGPARSAGLPQPELVVLDSPYRYLVGPIVEHAVRLQQEHPDRTIAVIIPELVESRWYNYFLHNNRAALLKAALLFRGNESIVVINIPWYLEKKR